MRPQQVLLLQVREDQGLMALKRYSTFPKAPGPELHHPMQFSIIFQATCRDSISEIIVAQSAGAVEYTECASAEG